MKLKQIFNVDKYILAISPSKLIIIGFYEVMKCYSETPPIDVVPKKTRSPHPWRRQPATARDDTAVPRPTWTPPPSSVDWVNIFPNASQIFMQATYL